jgi:hypothetical protein
MSKKIEKIENLVICSTLNQITNYLIMKKFKPRQIFNITFKEDVKKQFNINIKPHDWDKYLKETIKDINIINIELSENDFINIEKIKENINNKILKEANGEIYWHITGGQRTLALAIYNILNNRQRKEDKILYVEGNTEQLIIHNFDMSIDTKLDNEYNNNYSLNDLTLEEAFKLVGFGIKDIKTDVRSENFKEKGKAIISESNEEYKFYLKIHELMLSDKEYILDINFNNEPYSYKDTFKNLLIESNRNTDEKKSMENKQKFIDALFDKVKKHNNFTDINYKLKEKEEYKKKYPAGYIFEKTTAFKIYDLIKNNSKIVEMKASLKTELEGEVHPIDELDIVLLTNTGKIINFECKSGGMSGDNAKSHNYTTYRLNGVFGMPILLSPLYTNEVDKEKISNESNEEKGLLKSCREAYKSARRAELERICIDEIEAKLEKLLK